MTENLLMPTGWPESSDWTASLSPLFRSRNFTKLLEFVDRERVERTVFPSADETFNAFRYTPLQKTKVVILGQDPYHGAGQAHGLSFSVKDDIKPPPSLRNIFKERAADVNCEISTNGNLTKWARQGVLLLNTVLTVREGQANSHRKQGWEQFTDGVIETISRQQQPVVFVLWGKPAEKKLSLIAQHHATIVSAHPSPLSAFRGFFGSRPFSRTNQLLIESGQSPIDWA